MAEELDAQDMFGHDRLLYELRHGNPELIEPEIPVDARESVIGLGDDIRAEVDREDKVKNKLAPKVWSVHEDL